MNQPGESPRDPILEQLAAKPFRIARPAVQTVPFVFASPHSGRTYPPALLAASRLGPLSLRRSEDAFVDELFAGAVALGAPLIAAEFPRIYIDVNRAESELDGQMFDPALTAAAANPRVTAGLGVIPRIVRDGTEIYRGKLKPAEAESRIRGFYRPYHAALAALVEDTYTRFGTAVVVDCHSMPSLPPGPAIVIGDCHGTSMAPALSHHAERHFAAAGFSTARNAPYAGGFTTHHYARPNEGIHAFQIEVNRGLYLDEETIERSARFAETRTRLTAVLAGLLAYDTGSLNAPKSLAAE